MSRLLAGLAFLLVNALALMSAPIRTQPRPVVEEPAVSGYVLAPDGTAVSGGTVVAQSGFASTTASIDRTGRFRLIPTRPGSHQFMVSVPGLAPQRVTVTVPASRTLRLPVMRLVAGSYFRVRLVSPAGEPIIAPRLRRQMFDRSGKPIFDWFAAPGSDSVEFEGDAVTIGPLPRGIMSLAVDMPQFAQTRLPDVNFRDANRVDGGIVAIQQPGGVLHVDVVDGAGVPVPNHDVLIDDPRPRSPLVFRPVRTNQQGRATFDRLAPGRYRVLSTAAKRCGDLFLATSRLVSVSGSGTVEMPLVVGGRVTFRITSPLGPVRGVPISAGPSVPPPSLPFPFSSRSSPGCRGGTASDGRVTFTNFPPGPAHVDVHMTNSTFVRQLDVLSDDREMVVAIPEGLLPVHVVDSLTRQPIAGATVTWTGSGARVEGTVTVTGDALLEGVGTAGGTLATSARGYKPAEDQITELPALSHTVALAPLPAAGNLRARVITTAGEPMPDAVVAVIPANPADVPHVAVTDAKGVVAFPDAPPGSLQLIASADGFVALPMGIGDDRSSEVVFRLSRGYRVIASVEVPLTAGPQVVRVMNSSNASMDDLLDTESDRRFEPPGRLSLGPLPAGAYVIELHGADNVRKERIRIVDGDVHVTFR